MPQNPTKGTYFGQVQEGNHIAESKQAFYKGYLLKKSAGTVSRGWKQRYFVLSDVNLCYYDKKEDYPTKPPKGRIYLLGARVSDLGGERPHAFQLHTEAPPSSWSKAKDAAEFREYEVASTSTKGRVFFFDAEKRHEKEAWIRTLEAAIPTPLFGVALKEACRRDNGQVPLPLRICVDWLNEHGVEPQGLYRVCAAGNLKRCENLIRAIDRGEKIHGFKESESPANVMYIMIEFLRRCPDCLFSNDASLREAFNTAGRMPKGPTRTRMMRSRVQQLPEHLQACLWVLCDHLALVCSNGEYNNATPEMCANTVYQDMAATLAVCVDEFTSIFQS
jgi:hypothetical protein